MNPVEIEHRGEHRLTWAESERQLLYACARLGGLAAAARMVGIPLDRVDVAATVEGLRRLLAEVGAE